MDTPCRRPLTRHNCGQSIFGGCDPNTCTRECFTARAIDINRRHQPSEPIVGTKTLLVIFAISVAGLAWCAADGLGRAETEFQQSRV